MASGLPPLNTRLQALKPSRRQTLLDSAGPLSAGVQSPFLASPIMASTLLLASKKVAPGLSHINKDETTPVVLHPVPVPLEDDLAKLNIQPKTNMSFYGGQVKPIAVAAFQDLLFLTRIAKW